MEVVELESPSTAAWNEVVAGEVEPWSAQGEALEWADKDRNIALRADDGRLVAIAGAVVVAVAVAGDEPFEVVGLGGLFVTAAERGHGLLARIAEPLLAVAGELGPQRAMLFCAPELIGVYRRFAFAQIDAPVWVDQRDGRIEMPMPAMWRALHGAVDWPAGRVDVRGRPF